MRTNRVQSVFKKKQVLNRISEIVGINKFQVGLTHECACDMNEWHV